MATKSTSLSCSIVSQFYWVVKDLREVLGAAAIDRKSRILGVALERFFSDNAIRKMFLLHFSRSSSSGARSSKSIRLNAMAFYSYAHHGSIYYHI